MWELDHEESWIQKNWCFQTVVLEKTLENPLDGKEIQPVNPKGNKSWIFIGRTDTEAEAPVLWPPDAKSWLIWKYSNARKDWGQEEKGTTEDEMAGWHHRDQPSDQCMIATWSVHDQSRDQCMISHVITEWSAKWSVNDQLRDQCMISHVISEWSVTWSVHGQSHDQCMIIHVISECGVM